MHGHVMRAVRGDRQVEGFGEVRDLHEGGDAAAIGHVRLGIGDAAATRSNGGNPRACAGFRPPRSATRLRARRAHGRPRRRARSAPPARSDRRAERRARRGSPRRRVHFMLASTISGNSSRDGRAWRRPARHPPTSVLAADLHLDGAKPLGEVAVGLAQQLVERSGPDRCRRHSRARADRCRRAGSRAAGSARFAFRSQSAMSKAERASTVGPPRPP